MVAALAVGLGLLGVVPTGLGRASLPASAASTLESSEPGSTGITWRPCTDARLARLDLECGRLAVPRDHARPDGPTISLALTRLPHTGATYDGVMLTNPGGPGGSGLSMPAIGDYVPGGAGETYDWIGFDPRGVGASQPALRCDRNHFGYDRPSYVPRKQRTKRYWLLKSRRYASACANTAAKRALLPHLTSMDTVRDMEAIRIALGAERISFYGYSYGTYLGQLYATRHPTRVHRFVLDSVVNPARVWYAANLDQDRAFEANLDAFWRYLAAHPGTFHLGKRWRTIKRGYHRTLARLDRKPAAGRRLGPAELSDALLDAAYVAQSWAQLGHGYSDLVRRGRGGVLLASYRDGYAGDDNSYAVYNAVQCTDLQWPGTARTLRDAWSTHRRAPFATWGNTWYNAPCLSWRAPARTRSSVSGRALSTKVLLISETRDAATPYSGALAARRLFPSASLVAGVGGTTHASSLSGVACVDNTVAQYLRTGVVPARRSGEGPDRRCPRVAPPPSWDYWGRPVRGARTGMPQSLRAEIVAAQRAGR
jgi:pimeloyl-ACP methyl ester carboxylesterase